MKPIISVIVPAYNEEKYLPNCLKVLTNQDFRLPYEIIVVDNNSTDKTSSIAKSHKVKVILQPKQGLILTRQTGFKNAQGDYLATIDADCLPPRDWLSRIYQDYQKNKKVIAVAGPTYAKGANLYSRYFLPFSVFFITLWTKIFSQPLGVWSNNLSFKKSVLKMVLKTKASLPNLYDNLELGTQLKKAGQIFFDKNLYVRESERRYQHRFSGFLFSELIPNSLSYFYYRLTGKVTIPDWRDYR